MTDIDKVILEAVWIMRWTENQKAMYAVLSVEEARSVVLDVQAKLDEAGYKIVKK